MGAFGIEELLRRQANRSSSGLPFIYVVIVGFIGIILGCCEAKALACVTDPVNSPCTTALTIQYSHCVPTEE
ncbi:hypothetical protein CUMW_063030 [Citrus unshiu]|nr:hypothetical protein CUMW_063030 [Citrus unshiu]